MALHSEPACLVLCWLLVQGGRETFPGFGSFQYGEGVTGAMQRRNVVGAARA